MTPDDPDFSIETVGLKAYNLKRLKKMKNKDFQVPNFVVVPAGVIIDSILVYGANSDKDEKQNTYLGLVKEATQSETPSEPLSALRTLIKEEIKIPDGV